ncbi:MAG: hypothetical protein K2M59_04725 [Muribaculaceae bacterium]|nr:hypothetical protein [Muribaculaceae bacterium]
MRIFHNVSKRVAATGTGVVAAILMLGLASCKGRTMENMEPTGDTVEVSIMNLQDHHLDTADRAADIQDYEQLQ